MSAEHGKVEEVMCGTCIHWELVPQGCSSFWARCLYDGQGTPAAVPGQDMHFGEGADCECWESRRS